MKSFENNWNDLKKIIKDHIQFCNDRKVYYITNGNKYGHDIMETKEEIFGFIWDVMCRMEEK